MRATKETLRSEFEKLLAQMSDTDRASSSVFLINIPREETDDAVRIETMVSMSGYPYELYQALYVSATSVYQPGFTPVETSNYQDLTVND